MKKEYVVWVLYAYEYNIAVAVFTTLQEAEDFAEKLCMVYEIVDREAV